jgi:hypothetical protein
VITLRPRPSRRPLTATLAVLALLGTGFLLRQRYAPRAITVTAGKHPEELVYVRSNDDVINGGMIFNAPRNLARPIAVIWVHGWGTNFYYPTYTMIGRALAERGYTGISVNTRMHDIANIEDFFGVETPHPAATRIRCPILAFYATRNDVGNEADLDLLKTCTQRLSSGPSRVETVMIQNTDHMYAGEEAQVAEVIARWADALVPPEQTGLGGVQGFVSMSSM